MRSEAKKIIFGLIVLVFIIIFIFTIFFFTKKDSAEEINIYKETSNYKIDITYPITPISSINNKIKEMINNYRYKFINEIENKNIKYILNIKYDLTNYENLIFIHFEINNYSNFNSHTKTHITYYYDKKLNKEVNINNIILNKNILADLVNREMINYTIRGNLNFNNNIIRNKTKYKIGNYNNIILNNNGLEILFSNNDFNYLYPRNFKIIIPYSKLKGIIKDKYIKEKKYKYDFSYKRDLEQFKNKKLLAITFDDGPNYGTTDILLDELKKRDVKATFFVVGQNALNYPELVRREYLSGHQVGSHTFSHKQLTRLDSHELSEEVNYNNEIIKNITGKYPTLLRPPYGSFNDEVKRISDMYIILWNIDTLDWKNRNKDAVYNNIINEASDGDIILLHDLYQSSVEGVLMAIDKLKEEGFEFVTIDEMAKIKNNYFDKSNAYFNF